MYCQCLLLFSFPTPAAPSCSHITNTSPASAPALLFYVVMLPFCLLASPSSAISKPPSSDIPIDPPPLFPLPKHTDLQPPNPDSSFSSDHYLAQIQIQPAVLSPPPTLCIPASIHPHLPPERMEPRMLSLPQLLPPLKGHTCLPLSQGLLSSEMIDDIKSLQMGTRSMKRRAVRQYDSVRPSMSAGKPAAVCESVCLSIADLCSRCSLIFCLTTLRGLGMLSENRQASHVTRS